MEPDEINLWSLAVDGIADEAWPALNGVLDDEERARAARFRFDRDRRAYVAAHALLRHMLSHYLGRPPESWRFVAGEHGKPGLADPPPGRDLRFNLTHSRGMVAAVVAAAAEVGVDVESLDAAPAVLAVADLSFTAGEMAGLSALPTETEKAERLLRLWTLKEALVKATGKGLAQPLSGVAVVSLAPARVAFPDRRDGDGARWAFWQGLAGNHVLAVAVDWPRARPPTIRHRPLSPPPAGAGRHLFQDAGDPA